MFLIMVACIMYMIHLSQTTVGGDMNVPLATDPLPLHEPLQLTRIAFLLVCVCAKEHKYRYNLIATGVTYVSDGPTTRSLDERLLLLARKATEAVEALALAVAVVKAAV